MQDQLRSLQARKVAFLVRKAEIHIPKNGIQDPEG